MEVVKYLVGKKANIDSKQVNGMTALHMSAWMGRFEMATFLVENGANVEARDDTGKTPLHWFSFVSFDGTIYFLRPEKSRI